MKNICTVYSKVSIRHTHKQVSSSVYKFLCMDQNFQQALFKPLPRNSQTLSDGRWLSCQVSKPY